MIGSTNITDIGVLSTIVSYLDKTQAILASDTVVRLLYGAEDCAQIQRSVREVFEKSLREKEKEAEAVYTALVTGQTVRPSTLHALEPFKYHLREIRGREGRRAALRTLSRFCPGLRSLDLSDCTRLGRCAQALTIITSEFPLLEELQLSNCGLEENSFSQATLAQMRHLKVVDVSQNPRLLGEMLKQLPPTLEKVDVRDTGIKGELLLPLTRLQRLKSAVGLQTTEEILLQLPASLERLGLVACKDFTPRFSEKLRGLRHLAELHFSQMNPASFLDKLPTDLFILKLFNCPLQDNDMASIARLQSLRRLSIESADKLSGRTFSSLPESLRELRVDNCKSLNETFFPHLQHLVRLQFLSLQGMRFSGEQLDKLPSNISRLSLRKVTGLKAKNLQKLERLPHLIILQIDGAKLKAHEFRFLPSQLEELSIGNHGAPDGSTISKSFKKYDLRFLTHLVHMRLLSISGPDFHGTSLPLLFEQMKRLRQLTLSRCNNLVCGSLASLGAEVNVISDFSPREMTCLRNEKIGKLMAEKTAAFAELLPPTTTLEKINRLFAQCRFC